MAPSVWKIKPDRCMLSLYLCVTMQQQFIFPITHSIHTIQLINILSDYRLSYCLAIFFKKIDHKIILSTPPFLLGRVEPPTTFSKSESSKGFQFKEGVAAKEWATFFKVCSSYIKNKLKYEIFNDKNVYKQKYFSVITKNLNWEF